MKVEKMRQTRKYKDKPKPEPTQQPTQQPLQTQPDLLKIRDRIRSKLLNHLPKQKRTSRTRRSTQK
jgi:hypothetical protein